jgi:hypothetical protein
MSIVFIEKVSTGQRHQQGDASTPRSTWYLQVDASIMPIIYGNVTHHLEGVCSRI